MSRRRGWVEGFLWVAHAETAEDADCACPFDGACLLARRFMDAGDIDIGLMI